MRVQEVLFFIYICHQLLVCLFCCEKGMRRNVEKVRQKVTGGDKRKEKSITVKTQRRKTERMWEGKLEMCNAVFPLVYRIKLTLPGVVPQAQTATISHHHTLHAVCTHFSTYTHIHPAVWYESRLVPSWYKCLGCENSSLGIPTKYLVLVSQ